MREYIRETVEEAAKELFHPADIATVVSWWIANEGRKPVVVVGSGFTRNAVYKSTNQPVRAEHAPLWPEVSKAFADDLRIGDATGVDALTLAELHRDGLGERRFHDLLRGLLPDEELEPGRAHKALFDFELEAIVTTNCLDTLLDRDSRCVRVFSDAELGQRIDKPGKIEVLYFHGHRSSAATWVMSRSQYEDLPRKIPMILTRVRQLLSQHPVLTVGFSMTDPDFHQIYRQISLDMQVTNPLGLALLTPIGDGRRVSEQEAAQRRHWERLGMRMACFNDWENLNEKFEKFFRMLNPIEVTQLKDRVQDQKHSFAKRVAIAKSALEDPNVSRFVHTSWGWENAIWRLCIDSGLSRDERKEIEEKIQRVHREEFGGSAASDGVAGGQGLGARSAAADATRVKFKHASFEEHKIRRDWELAWMADRWLEVHRPTAIQFASWLHYRIEKEYWDLRGESGRDLDIHVAVLLGAVWRAIDDTANDDTANPGNEKPHRREPLRQLEVAYRFLRKYRATEEANQIQKDIVALGGSVLPADPAEQAPVHMKTAFQYMMNGEYEKAAKEYDLALQDAKKLHEPPFLTWLAATGRFDAFARFVDSHEHYNKKTDEERALRTAYQREARACEQAPMVKRWKEEAERRLSALAVRTIKNLQEAERSRNFEGRGSSWSDTSYLALRSFCDLEAWCAPPNLQLKYLQPLIDGGVFSAEEEFQYRLQFQIEKTKEWIDAKLDELGSTIVDAANRDKKLLDAWQEVWQAQDSTKTAQMASLRVLKPMLQILSPEQETLGIELLERVAALGTVVEYYRGWSRIEHDIASAWRDCARVLCNKDSFSKFKAYADSVKDDYAADDMDRNLGSLPWYEWLLRGIAKPDELVDWIVTRRASRAPGEGSYGVVDGIGDALIRVVGNQGVAPGGLAPTGWDRLGQWCRDTLQAISSGKGEGTAAILNLLGFRYAEPETQGDDALWNDVEEKIFQILSERLEACGAAGSIAIDRFHSIAFHLGIVLIREQLEDRWKNLAEKVWRAIVENWDRVKEHVQYNLDESRKVGLFLAGIIQHDMMNHRGEACSKLLEIWSASTSITTACYDILDKRFWPGESWSQLLAKLREGLGGARGRFSASWQMAICSLLRQAVLHSKTALSSELLVLADQVALLVANEETIVANHAAYASALFAELCTDEEAARVALLDSTLRAIAEDTRLSVRHAAAYAAGRLPKTAKSERIKGRAAAIREQIEKEHYLVMKRQIELGEAEGMARVRELEKRSASASES